MRRNSVRHFIHMVLDVLPLLIIPIFALNILHKETEPISIEVQEKVSVDFNQKASAVDITGTKNGVDIEKVNYIVNLSGTTTNSGYQDISTEIYTNLTIGHEYLMYLNISTTMSYSTSNCQLYTYGANVKYDIRNNYTFTANANYLHLVFVTYVANLNVNFAYNRNIIDLTQIGMTQQEFENTFTDSFYPYTESQKMLVNKPSPTTYNSTDIGSQFIYALYKPVNDYFNFNNLFNMGAIYNWIELNLFSGTAPLPIFIIWNVIVYEFFIDLIFLLYYVFMFVIDFATSMIDRFMYKSKRGI